MASRIITKKGSGAPLASDLVHGELAVDTVNKRLYTENAGGTVIEVGTSPSTIDINAGTIDGTVIGGTTAAAGTFTSITGTSANINGTVTADGLTVGGTGTGDGVIVLKRSSDGLTVGQITVDSSGARLAESTAYSHFDFLTEDTKRGLRISNGDISFYEDTGTTAKFFWDASAENLLIGEDSSNRIATGANLALGDADGALLTIGSTKFNNFNAGDVMGAIEFRNADGSATEFTKARIAAVDDSASVNQPYPLGVALAFSTTSGNTLAERMRIDSAGNVGIGTIPSSKLNVEGTITIGATGHTYGAGALGFSDGNWGFIYRPPQAGLIGAHSFTAFDGSNLAVITESGNLLVGTTTSLTNAAMAAGGTGFEATDSGLIRNSRNNGTVNIWNRNGTDGTLSSFFKDGVEVGSIGVGNASSYTYIGTGDTGVMFNSGGDFIQPWNPSTNGGRDNAIDLGNSGNRFDDIYATNGTIQTSDANEKQDIEALSEAEQRVAVAAKGLLRKFRWKDSVAEKGDEARIHFGIIAQDLQSAFEAEGLDAGDYAMFIHSTWTDEETGEERSRMGVRYSELLAFIIAAI